jgi:hypothetical protein
LIDYKGFKDWIRHSIANLKETRSTKSGLTARLKSDKHFRPMHTDDATSKLSSNISKIQKNIALHKQNERIIKQQINDRLSNSQCASSTKLPADEVFNNTFVPSRVPFKKVATQNKLTTDNLSQLSSRPKSCFSGARDPIYGASQRLKNTRNKVAAKLISDLEDAAALSRAGEMMKTSFYEKVSQKSVDLRSKSVLS